MFFFFKQKTAYEMRISDWSSDVCSSDLTKAVVPGLVPGTHCSTRLKVLPLKGGAFAAGGDNGGKVSPRADANGSRRQAPGRQRCIFDRGCREQERSVQGVLRVSRANAAEAAVLGLVEVGLGMIGKASVGRR